MRTHTTRTLHSRTTVAQLRTRPCLTSGSALRSRSDSPPSYILGLCLALEDTTLDFVHFTCNNDLEGFVLERNFAHHCRPLLQLLKLQREVPL